MTSIQIDDKTAAGLAAIAAGQGLTVEEYLRAVIARETGGIKAISPQDFEAELDRLVFDGPSLPPNFSRADIYAERD